ncbi:hypothetical protein [Paenibacillus soyae]|uniref:Uncharacterized protein n=1 Tax=Paenibacillus soyae TaxID=2969249 RepID=A0A9X2MLG4_9BACL|nr:hypothetical protein [Paenibacillus soyae]MCR2802390.1 hypothetical protein [Paenibacillus soyae]
MTELTFDAITITMLLSMMAGFQLFMAFVLYRLERSAVWALLALLFPLGLNVLLYQAVKLDISAGPDFEGLTDRRRRLWRGVYLFLLLQYMALFGLLGWFLSPVG